MPRASRRDAILDAAERLVRRQGFHGLSIRDVAAAVGVRPAAVHYHFAAKADLVEAVTNRYATRFLTDLGYATEPLPDGVHPMEGMVDGLWHPGRRLLWAGVGPRSSRTAKPNIPLNLLTECRSRTIATTLRTTST